MNNIRISRGLVNQLYAPDNQATSVRLTLTPQAIRNNKFDFSSGRFDNGYPFNDVYFFCKQNLTIIHKYASLQWSRNPVAQISHPVDISNYIINGDNVYNKCDFDPPIPSPCVTTCTPPTILDAASCSCVPIDECIPQDDCTPLPLPTNLKNVIEGYAFYVDRPASVNIPGLNSPIAATCWGGHVCCRTIFKPKLILSDSSIIDANRTINMNNANYGGCIIGGQIPIPDFVNRSGYELSDSFTIVVPDANDLQDSNVYLECELPNNGCHFGVTMVVLVGETITNEKVLLFASCVSPGAINSKPMGTIDCATDPGDAVPCVPPTPPTPTIPTPTPTPPPPMGSGWQITDGTTIYAQGPIVYCSPEEEQLAIYLDDFPSPFQPNYYDSTGGKTFSLIAIVDGESTTLETWNGSITLCNNISDRFPIHNFNTLSWPPAPTPCASFSIGDLGDGQEWRDPQPSGAYKFTGSVDGEWTNLNNWEDSSGLSPAASLPDTNSSVIINAPVTSVPSGYTISVDSLTVNGNGVIYVWIRTNSLTVYGKIGCLSPCNSEARPVSGTVVVDGSTSVFDGGILEGFVVAPNATTIFKNTAYIQAIGWTECDDPYRNCGYLTGDAEFNTGSFNDGYVNPSTSAGVVFNDNTQNRRCADGTVTFNDNSSNTSTGTVLQAGIFNDSSANEGTVGIATFNDSSFNHNIVLNPGTTTFNGSSRNSSTGKINGNAIFNLTSTNAGDIDGNATFNDSSRNDDGTDGSPATIGGNLLFKDTSYNITNNTYAPVVSGTTTFEDSSSNRGFISSANFTETSYNDTGAAVQGNASFSGNSSNKGNITGTATFTDSACNNGGTAGTFIPDPPPSC